MGLFQHPARDLPLPCRAGNIERLAVLVDAEGLEDGLCLGQEHEVGEGLAARGVHAGPFAGLTSITE
jgi:hypothetical protein